jgi:hypothetical protein
MADAHEAAWEHMEQEAPQKLIDVKRHEPPLVVVRGIAPAEGDMIIFKLSQPMIGDGHAMRVAAEIAESVLRSAKGPLSVDDPLFPKGLPQRLREDLGSR